MIMENFLNNKEVDLFLERYERKEQLKSELLKAVAYWRRKVLKSN